ncbi:hypothetical protein TNCV_2318671 [Trichonephila clavipes]|nr:hypothetical protein TNCV_2318671 [Trichonephila clavipes]
MESLQEPQEIGNLIEEVVDLSKQINSEVDSDDVQVLLDCRNQELKIVELIEMHEQCTPVLGRSLDYPRSYRTIFLVRFYANLEGEHPGGSRIVHLPSPSTNFREDLRLDG